MNFSAVVNDPTVFAKTFKQQAEGKVHDSMGSIGLRIRESHDSEAHPNVVPIIIALDVTGSMDKVPKQLVAEGLPKLITGLLAAGVDPAVCFIAIGDHKSDYFPLQVAQFESGDEELDMWLTRTFLEGKGGGNGGESYSLAWLFAARYTEIHSLTKRGQKGFLFTIGDEPNHSSLDKLNLNRIFGGGFETDLQSKDLLKEAQEKYHVYHLNVLHGYAYNTKTKNGWGHMGEHAIDVYDAEDVAPCIIKTVSEHAEACCPDVAAKHTEYAPKSDNVSDDEDMM